MYKVIKYFVDLQDGNHPYNVGDAFPRKGASASDGRIAELAGRNNLQNTPLIAKVEEKPDEKPTKKGAKKPAAE